MKIYLRGHDYKYAVEQIMLVMFPGERPEYPEDGFDFATTAENAASVSLTYGKTYATAVTKLVFNGKQALGTARIAAGKLTGELALSLIHI